MARFFNLTPDVSVQYWLEFMGEKALWVKDFKWPEKHYVPKDPNRKNAQDIPLDETARFYLEGVVGGEGSVIFDRSVFDRNPVFNPDAGEVEDFCKLQFKRENGARIVHFRPSDENPALLGFGRPNPNRKHPVTGEPLKCHKDFSETFVDRKPGTVFINYKGEEGQIWEGFKPVWLKVLSATNKVADIACGCTSPLNHIASDMAQKTEGVYYLKVWTEWCDSEIFVLSEMNPSDVPQELRDYEFKNDSESRLDPAEEEVIKKYTSHPRIRR